jgi:oligopeptide/dipeptide ABC transporter ATP-binding protein
MEKGETEEVLKGKHHPYTCSLIDSIPRNGMKPNRGFIPSSLEELVGCPFQPRCPKGRDMEIHEYVQRELNQSHSVWCKDA